MKPQIEHLPLDTLIPYARNSRTHSPEQIAQVAASIREFGFTNPVLIDAQGGIIAGHGRVMAARQLGLSEVPCIRLGHLTDAQKRAYVIADNKLALNAGWDDALLALELRELDGLGFDLHMTGFNDDEISKLLDLELGEGEGQGDADVVPEVRPDPISRPRDVWVLGRHRVMCGDSADREAVGQLLEWKLADAVVTDPPYGIGVDGQKKSTSKNQKHNRKAHEFRGWDSKRPPREVFRHLLEMKVPSVIWGGNYFADLLPATRGWIYWSKGQDGLSMSDGELAWTTETKPLRCVTVNRGVLQGSIHPTQKPLQVIEFSLDYIEADDTVLDLFGGSGTTLIACEKTGRTARLMELDPRYCDVIVRRWQDFTGQRATHAETGDPFPEASRA